MVQNWYTHIPSTPSAFRRIEVGLSTGTLGFWRRNIEEETRTGMISDGPMIIPHCHGTLLSTKIELMMGANNLNILCTFFCIFPRMVGRD